MPSKAWDAPFPNAEHLLLLREMSVQNLPKPLPVSIDNIRPDERCVSGTVLFLVPYFALGTWRAGGSVQLSTVHTPCPPQETRSLLDAKPSSLKLAQPRCRALCAQNRPSPLETPLPELWPSPPSPESFVIARVAMGTVVRATLGTSLFQSAKIGCISFLFRVHPRLKRTILQQ